MTKGFILGKFVPLHKGHQFLIETALKQVDELYVVIYDNRDFAIPLNVRIGWLMRLYPMLHIIPITELYKKDFTAAETWRNHEQLIKAKLPEGLTHFFSSEDHSYYQLLAKHLAVRHVIVDKERATIPVRGGEIMANPAAYKDFLDPIVWDYFQ